MSDSILEKIQSALETIDKTVFYGLASHTNKWNYIVFKRDRIKGLNSKVAKSTSYTVAVVRENYVPEGTEDEIVRAMKTIAGMKVAEEDPEYEYTKKTGTDTIVEILVLHFVKAESKL